MHLLLCSATPFEIQPTIDFIGTKGIPNVSVLVHGVGLTAATYALTKEVLKRRPHFILQAGVAGTLDKHLSLTKVVAVESEFIGDEGVFEGGNFRSLVDLGLHTPDALPFTKGKLVNQTDFLFTSGIPAVQGVTVNEIETNPQRIQYYRGLGAQVETLEGAALHYVALQENIPFFQLRSISNFAGDRDKKNWRLQQAIDALNKELPAIILKLSNI
jgi:futalosine hydrolase